MVSPRTQGPALFGRRYQVTLAPDPSVKGRLQYGNMFAGSSPLRVSFNVKKDCTGNPNPAHIVIYNMTAANRAVIEDGWAIQLQAGYRDTAQTIWLGQVGKGVAAKNPDLTTSQKASEQKQGSDISFAIESADGWGPIRFANIHQSYKKGISYQHIFDDIFKVMSTQATAVGFPVTKGSVPDLTDLGAIDKAIVLHGSCGDALEKLLKPFGYEWFVLDNQLTVCALDDHTKDGIPYLSATTGLLGIPSRENEKSVSLKCLLTPQLAPGRLLQLEANDKSFSGYYKVRSVEHLGDTNGDDWTSQVVCVPYTNPNLPITCAPLTG